MAFAGGLTVLGLLAFAATALARPTGGPGDPRLAPGSQVVVTETGFAPDAVVTVAIVDGDILGTTAADAGGRVRYRFTVPHVRSGQHALLFAGPARHPGAGPSGGNVSVTTPLLRTWRFRTPGPAGGGTSAPASARSGAAGEGAGHGPSGGGTAVTGADVLGALAAAVLVLVLGATLVLAARRRPRRG